MKKKMIRVGRTVCHEGFQEIYEHSGNTLGTEGNTADFLLILDPVPACLHKCHSFSDST